MKWINIVEQGKPKEHCFCWVVTKTNGFGDVRRAQFLPWHEGLFLFLWGEPDMVTHYIVEPVLPRGE